MKTKFVVITVFLFFAMVLTSSAQIKDNTLNNLNMGREYFYIDPLMFYPLDSSVGRLDLYIEVPLENLQFKKAGSNDNYESIVDMRITIKNSSDEQVFTQTYTDKINTTKSEQKNISGKTVSSVKNYFLNSGYYKIQFSLKDKNSGNEYIKDFSIKVKDPTIDRIVGSDIMLLTGYEEDSNGEKEITPLISSNIGDLENFYIFSEIYNRTDEEVSKILTIKTFNEKEKVVFDTIVSVNVKKGKNTIIQKLYSDIYTIGNFRMEVYDGSNKLSERRFIYRWGDIPISIKDLDEAVSQLLYIATKSELDRIKDAPTSEEKLKRFMHFWRSIDPSPRTTKNEILIEYYNRIKIANERYSHYVDGWKTDMGMVFIIYGNPSVIDRHPFESDSKPYEIWTYYDINRQYIFVDYTGFGDYRLTTPIYDHRTKIRL